MLCPSHVFYLHEHLQIWTDNAPTNIAPAAAALVFALSEWFKMAQILHKACFSNKVGSKFAHVFSPGFVLSGMELEEPINSNLLIF